MRCRLSLAIACFLACAPFALPLHGEEGQGRQQFDEYAQQHWSFQPLKRPAVPETDSQWAANPIDAYILAGLKSAGLQPSPAADRATLLRRVYLDLIGLPPTPEEVDAFLADPSPLAYEQVVDDLLSRPQYGERWARHWLDVVRYGETNGYERDGAKPEAWKYRQWVIDALNADMPYDQFVTEQLAGDEVEGSDARSQIATTMLRLGPWDDEPADELQSRYDQLDDIVGATSAAFIGMTLRCARCHDHKFEPLLATDYARWMAIFEPLKRPQDGRTDLSREVGRYEEIARHKALVAQLDAQKGDLEKQIRTQEWQTLQQAVADGRLPLAQLAAGQTVAADPAKNLTDDLLALCKELPGDALTAAGTDPGQRNDAQRKLIGQHAEKIAKLTRAVAGDEQRTSLDEMQNRLGELLAKYPAPLPRGYIWFEEGKEFRASHVFDRGDPRSPGAEVQPGFPTILVSNPPQAATPTERSTGRRRQLAQWLTEDDHPLTARVMVNRIWQHHFGDGLVSTENDFGVMGEPPSHPELLDWLATELVAGGWRMKRIHRMMVFSQTYQQSSAASEQSAVADPSGRLLWRYPPRRLAAEALRDSILAVSGQLNLASGGPSIFPKISRAVLETQSVPGAGWQTSEPAAAARRSVYIFVKRTLIVPEMEVLDFPGTEESCQQRVVSTVAPQALTLLNGEFMHEQAEAMAQRLARETGRDDNARIERAYRLVFSRPPRDDERQMVREFLARQRGQIVADSPEDETVKSIDAKSLKALCLVLLNTNEFAYLQ